MISKNHKKTCTNSNYIKGLLTLASKVTGCVSISSSVSLAAISVDIASYAVQLKICAISAGIKKHGSWISSMNF